jgi:hypothetical protein
MRGNLDRLKKVIDADVYSTGGMLQRAQSTAVSKEEENALEGMITTRCKKKNHSYGRK